MPIGHHNWLQAERPVAWQVLLVWLTTRAPKIYRDLLTCAEYDIGGKMHMRLSMIASDGED